MIRRGVARSHPSLQPLLIFQEETSSFSPSQGPSPRPLEGWPSGPVGPRGRQGRPLLYQEPPLGVGGREEETLSDLPVASPQESPMDQGLQVLSIGPDLRCFPTHSAPPPTPGGRCRGPPCCPLAPASSLAGRGGGAGGLALQFGSRLPPGSLQGPHLPSPPGTRPPPLCPCPRGPKVVRAELDSGCQLLVGEWASAMCSVAWGCAEGTGSDPTVEAEIPGPPPRGAPVRPQTT